MRALLAVLALMLTLAGCGREPADGRPLALEDFRGRWLVINYWAEWCKPCLTEIPELNEYAAEHPEDSLVLGVNYDGVTGAELERLIEQFDIRFQVIEDPADRFGYPRPNVLPTTVIIDPQGQVHDTLLGPQTLSSLRAAVPNRSPAPSPGH